MEGNDVPARKTTLEHGGKIHTFTAEQAKAFIQRSSAIDNGWVADMDKRGFKGAELLAAAKSLIAKNA